MDIVLSASSGWMEERFVALLVWFRFAITRASFAELIPDCLLQAGLPGQLILKRGGVGLKTAFEKRREAKGVTTCGGARGLIRVWLLSSDPS
jgi:hypothetical protein